MVWCPTRSRSLVVTGSGREAATRRPGLALMASAQRPRQAEERSRRCSPSGYNRVTWSSGCSWSGRSGACGCPGAALAAGGRERSGKFLFDPPNTGRGSSTPVAASCFTRPTPDGRRPVRHRLGLYHETDAPLVAFTPTKNYHSASMRPAVEGGSHELGRSPRAAFARAEEGDADMKSTVRDPDQDPRAVLATARAGMVGREAAWGCSVRRCGRG